LRLRYALAAAAVAALTGAALAVVLTRSASAPHRVPAAPCAAGTLPTLVADYETAARDIYRGERAGPEERTDAAHVTSATDLTSALAAGNQPATLAAVTRIVYRPHWHIVRLRVLSTSGRVLADVGGPYIIAPVRGKLFFKGAVVGSYVMSVQDDVGYAKLVARFTHLPVELYFHGRRLMGRRFPRREAPPRLPANGSAITVRGRRSVTVSYTARAFPSGKLHVLLAIPRPSARLFRQSCAVVSATTYGAIATDLAGLLNLPHSYRSSVPVRREYEDFVELDGDGGFGSTYVFVRHGARAVAGTVANGPKEIPRSGSLAFEGRHWTVFSFAPLPPTRIYLLLPESLAKRAGRRGASGAT
jgi:hypothetical protein